MKYFYRFCTLCISTLFLLYSLLLPSMSFQVSASTPDYVFLLCQQHSMKVGDEFYLQSITLSGRQPKFKSSKTSVASVSTYGIVTAKKPGTTRIIAKVSGSEAYCVITVLPTQIELCTKSVSLYRTGQYQLRYSTSTGHKATFQSTKSSVVSVTDNGLILAKKHGQANIKVKCDGTTVLLPVTVNKPIIKLYPETLTLHPGETFQFKATVSSGLKPTWSVSNINILSVTSNGLLSARQKGKAYLYACEDGTKVSCIVKVIDP